MTYTQVWDPTANAVSTQVIQRDEDGAFVPFDDANTDYQTYKAWLAEGNEPNSPPPVVSPASPEAAIADSAQSLEMANAKSLAAQGRTDEAVAALINLMEKTT